MWTYWKKHFKKRNWNNRKIAFISILIATSVAFVLLFTSIAPIAAIPSFKLAAGGLPVKLTGYIFGPIIGAITGAISDLISFLLRPTFYHFYYTLAWIAAGTIPGVVGFLMNRRWEKNAKISPEKNEKHSTWNFFTTLFILASIFAGIFVLIFTQPEVNFEKAKLVNNKYLFMSIALAGSATMFIAVIIFRFTLKPKTFNAIMPIVTFSALLEVFVTPLLTLGDMDSLIGSHQGESFLTVITGHLLLSPIKIWVNMIVILVAYKIVSPLIYGKTNNGWYK